MENNKQGAAVSSFYTPAWWIRHYCRPAKRTERAQAIQRLGAAVRAAFNETEDFEPLLRALADALAGAWPPTT